jgi:ABC-2 type transport system permease protein
MKAYLACFIFGARQTWHDRVERLSNLLILALLAAIFHTVTEMMPLHELNVPGLTAAHMLWYFVMAEVVIVAAPGMASYGITIGEGKLGEQLQRPLQHTFMQFCLISGAHLMQSTILLAFSLIYLPLVLGVALPMSLTLLPLLILAILLAIALTTLLTLMVGTLEIKGPYSRPVGWVVGKFIFAMGGLFFPVSYFPEAVRAVVMATPFPAILFVPGQFMLPAANQHLLMGLGLQIFWLCVLGAAAFYTMHRMVRYALTRGD